MFALDYFFDLEFVRLFRRTKIKSKLDKMTIDTMKDEIKIEADWFSKRLLTPREIINIIIGAAI